MSSLSGSSQIRIGAGAEAYGSNSVAIGYGARAGADEIAIGTSCRDVYIGASNCTIHTGNIRTTGRTYNRLAGSVCSGTTLTLQDVLSGFVSIGAGIAVPYTFTCATGRQLCNHVIQTLGSNNNNGTVFEVILLNKSACDGTFVAPTGLTLIGSGILPGNSYIVFRLFLVDEATQTWNVLTPHLTGSVPITATAFSGLLSPSDTTVQAALDTIDKLAIYLKAQNAGLGAGSTSAITTGTRNVFIGASTVVAGAANDQIAIGAGATTTGANAIAIGSNATAASNTTIIGTPATTTATVYGLKVPATDVTLDTAAFNNLFANTTAYDTVQKCLDKIDDHVHTAAATATSTVNFNNILSSSDTNVQLALDKLDEANQYNPTGFENRTDSVLTFGVTTVSIAPAATSFRVYVAGRLFTKTGTETVTRLGSTGLQYIYYNTAGVLTISLTPWDFQTNAPVALIYWDSGQTLINYKADERHTITMSVGTHRYLHNSVGSRWGGGFAITATTTGDGSLDSDAYISIDSGILYDEDIRIDIPAQALFPMFYKFSTLWRKSTQAASQVPMIGTTAPYYNTYTTYWTTVVATNTYFVAGWVAATNDIEYPIIVIVGQREDVDLAAAQNNNLLETLDLTGFPAQEIKMLYRVILEYNTAFTNSYNVRVVDYSDYRSGTGNIINGSYSTTSHSALSGLNNKNAHKGSAVSVTTTGWSGALAGVSGANKNVQYALDTLDDHTHAASTETVVTSAFGNLFANTTAYDTVQKCLDKIDDHSHSAAAITTNTANFNNILSSFETNVQLALDKLDEANQYNPTGFADRTSSKLTFGGTTVTIEPTTPGVKYEFYINGAHYAPTIAHSVTRINTDGLQYIYFNSSGVLTISTTPWVIRETAFVAIIYYSAASGQIIYTADERHTINMSSGTHSYLHNTIGTRYKSGLTLSYTLGSGGSDVDAQVAFDGGVIYDEDIAITISTPYSAGVLFSQNLALPATIPKFYRLGTDRWARAHFATYSLIYPCLTDLAGNLIRYNLNTAGSWNNTPATSGNFVAYFICATNDINYPIISIVGQRQDSSLLDAQTNNTYESLAFGTQLFAEVKVLYRVIFQTKSSYTNLPKAYIADVQDLRRGIISGGSYSYADHSSLSGLTLPNCHPATAIGVNTTAFGGVLTNDASSDTVQKCLDKLDDHVHAASTETVVTTAFGGVLTNDANSNTVQKCLDKLDDHVHAASTETVVTTAFGGVLTNDTNSDTVQKCLDKLDDHTHTFSGSVISCDTTNFNGTLSTSEDTVQKALDKMDDLKVRIIRGYNMSWTDQTHLYLASNTGVNNICIGPYRAGYLITSGNYNICIGYNSGGSISSGSYNVCLGYMANVDNDSSNQISIGRSAVCSGTDSIAIGTSTTASAGQACIAACTTANSLILGNTATTANTLYGTVIVQNNAANESKVRLQHNLPQAFELYSADGATEHGTLGWATAGGNYVNQASAGDICIRSAAGTGMILGYAAAGKNYMRVTETDTTLGSYTKLGSDAPAIKIQRVTGTLPAQGSSVSINVNVTGTTTGYLRILDVSGVCYKGTVGGFNYYDAIPDVLGNSDYWSCYYGGGQLQVSTGSTSNLGGQPYSVIITYIA